MCFCSNKEAPTEDPGGEEIIGNHITLLYSGMFNAPGCSLSV